MSKDLFHDNIESYIVHMLEVKMRITVSELCEVFQLAPSTVRKKLAKMESMGLLIRTHGGAVSVDANRDEPIDRKSTVNIPQKKAIASAAVELINDGDVISLGGGTTVAEMGVYCLKLKDSIVLTNSIVLANLVMSNKNIEVRINSGIVRGRTGCIVGPGAEKLFLNSVVDKAFVSCDAFNLNDGPCSANILVGEVESVMLSQALEKYILCDSSKLNKTTITPICKCRDFTALITDDDADPYYINQLRESGLKVIVAPVFHTKRTIRGMGDMF